MSFKTMYIGKETSPNQITKWAAGKAILIGSHLLLWGVKNRGFIKPSYDLDDEELQGDLGLLGEWPDIV